MNVGVWTLANNTKHHSLFFSQKTLLLLVLAADWKGVCRLENWALIRKGLLWDYEESETCATYIQSFCAWKAKSVVVIYCIGVVNTVIFLFHWNFPLQICIVNESHRSAQLPNKLWECAVWLKICTETLLSLCSWASFVLPFCPFVVTLYYFPWSETNSFFISIKAETTGFRLHFYFGGGIWLKSQLP